MAMAMAMALSRAGWDVDTQYTVCVVCCGTHLWGIATRVGRRVSSYCGRGRGRPIVLRRVVVRVAVARVEGGGDGRQLGGVGIGVGIGGMVRVWVWVWVWVRVLLGVRQGAVGGLVSLWWLWCAAPGRCLCLHLRRRALVVSCLPLVRCHHSVARVAVHGRATSPAQQSRAEQGKASKPSALLALLNHRPRTLRYSRRFGCGGRGEPGGDA